MAKKPLGLNSPPPARRGENKSGHDLTILKNELEHEKRLRETILWSNGELERIVYELEDEISEFDAADPNLAEPWNEWWVRLETQKNINEQLEQQRKWLELELEHAKQRAAVAATALPDAMNFDLDSLSETELIRLVKRLERQRTDLYSNLRNLEFRLDREGREQHRLAEMKTMYQAEMHHYTRTLDHLKQSQKFITTSRNKLNTSRNTKTADTKLPPLDVVQPPTTSRWGNSSQSKRPFNPNKGPTRRTAAGVRNLPKIPDKKVSTPRGKVDKRNRRIKSGNKEKRKEELKLADIEKPPTEIPKIDGAIAALSEIEVLPQPSEATPSFIMKTISQLAQMPLEIVDDDVKNEEEEEMLESHREVEDPNLEYHEDDTHVQETNNEFTEVTNEAEFDKVTEEIVEKTGEIKVTDEIECI